MTAEAIQPEVVGLDRPEPAPASHPAEAEREARVRVYIWQVPVRITHWAIAISIVVLSLTGGYIADPFLIPPGGSVMTTMRELHIVSAIVLLLAGLWRTVWLLKGNRFARWSAFIPTNWNQATELFRQAAFYAFIKKEIPKVLGHNQLAATAYIALVGLLVVEMVTGFVLYAVLGAEPAATLLGWVRELVGLQTIRLVHHLAMWGVLAIAVFHVYSCFLVDNIEKNGILTSIVNGYKFPTREEVLESRDGGPELLAEALEEDRP
ncbi:MAG TPA: Ni/Fe-hydrogenase, b-type cytochrome subunit [Candidatus Limnocylindrales bacterium]|nr:Ni/Fe-hydrogenase, b-type cytochrome subunit [Candidatus Limnocylindrales bacterium]